jgi:hypothetical protein
VECVECWKDMWLELALKYRAAQKEAGDVPN